MYLAVYALGLRVRDVVFMGMGEPLDNVRAVIDAVRVRPVRTRPAHPHRLAPVAPPPRPTTRPPL